VEKGGISGGEGWGKRRRVGAKGDSKMLGVEWVRGGDKARWQRKGEVVGVTGGGGA